MIAVDASALIAILDNEPECAEFLRIISDDGQPIVSAINLYEAGRAAIDDIEDLLTINGFGIANFDYAAAHAALTAYLAWGKRNHPAGLNLADCAAYALAKERSIPLLFKGSDFSKTDIVPASPPPVSPTP